MPNCNISVIFCGVFNSNEMASPTYEMGVWFYNDQEPGREATRRATGVIEERSA
jgi:hypothetical protein